MDPPFTNFLRYFPELTGEEVHILQDFDVTGIHASNRRYFEFLVESLLQMDLENFSSQTRFPIQVRSTCLQFFTM